MDREGSDPSRRGGRRPSSPANRGRWRRGRIRSRRQCDRAWLRLYGVEPRVWPAKPEDIESVSTLIAAFRDWWGKDEPALEQIRATTAVLLEDPATEFLLAAPDGDRPAAGVCQLRYRLSVWTGSD